MTADWRYDRPVRIAVSVEQTARASSLSYGMPACMSIAPRLA